MGVAELRRREAPVVRPQHREIAERVRADDVEGELAPIGERGDAAPGALLPRDPSTTWADVSRKPSGVNTIALPAPTGSWRPSRLRVSRRRLATEAASASATPTTVAL